MNELTDKMEQVNNIGVKSPLNVSEQLNGEKTDNGIVKPKLCIKASQAISLKNHMVDYEAVDSLNSKIEEETTYIVSKYSYIFFLRTRKNINHF